MADPDKILIVEDDQEINYMLSKSFSLLGYKVTSALDGFQALEWIEAERFSVAILDLMLPGPGGMEILKHLREDWPQTEVIILTAYASLDTALDALRLGAYDYVTKPFQFDILRSTVRRAAEKHHLETKLDAIYDLSREMALSLSVDQVVEVVLDIVERVLEFGACGVGLIDEERDELFLLTVREMGQEAGGDGPSELYRLPLDGGKGITVAVACSGELLYVPDVREEPRYVEMRAATRSELTVPLRVKERVIGVLDVERAEVDAFGEADVRLLSTLAAQAAVAIENARLYEQAQQEIAERKRAEEALRASEERFRDVALSTSDWVWEVDRHGRYTYCSERVIDVLGYTAEEMLSKTPFDLMLPEEAVRVVEIFTQIAADKQPIVDLENWNVRKDGREICLLTNGVPMLDQEGNLVGYRGVDKDITERKRAEDALRESEEAERAAREQAETLRQATAALASTLDLDVVLDSILTHLEQVIPYASASVFLHVQGKDRLRVVAAKGLPDPEQVIGHDFPADDALWLELGRTQRPLVLADARADHRFAKWGGFDYVRGWMGVPLIVRGEIIGCLTLDNRQVAAYGEADAALAQAFANQAAVAIQNARLFEQVRVGRERLQALSRRHVEAQEAERAHIARELHDETGQALSALLLGLSLFGREADRPEAVVARATELEETVDEMLENLHRLAMNLRPASLDLLGLVPALGQYIETFGDQHGMTAQFETLVGIRGERLSPPVETAIYRIVQEALTNVARHAQATHVDVLLERRGDRIVTIVEDDGVGFDVEGAMQSSRLGLFGMRERAEMLGGTLVVESTIGAGATVFVEIPDVKRET